MGLIKAIVGATGGAHAESSSRSHGGMNGRF